MLALDDLPFDVLDLIMQFLIKESETELPVYLTEHMYGLPNFRGGG